MRFQIGKAGVTEGVVQSLLLAFKNNKVVRISLLKSSGRDRNNIKVIADELVSKLPGNYVYTIIGFTIVLRRKAAKK